LGWVWFGHLRPLRIRL